MARDGSGWLGMLGIRRGRRDARDARDGAGILWGGSIFIEIARDCVRSNSNAPLFTARSYGDLI